MTRSIFSIGMLLLSWIFLPAIAQEKPPQTEEKAGIYEKLGQQVPAELTFTDEDNKRVSLKDVVNKPTILTLVYYRCPGICNPMLNELQKTLERIKMEPGKDFLVLTVSFDTTESSQVAAAKKRNYLEGMSRSFPPEAWRFFVGDGDNVKKLKDAVGFYAAYDKVRNEYLHEGVLIILSPEGKITRYIYLTKGFLPVDVQMALTEAKEGRISPTVPTSSQWCESKERERESKQKTLMLTTIGGAVIVVALGLFVTIVIFKGKKS